jgi:hypothetical protein
VVQVSLVQLNNQAEELAQPAELTIGKIKPVLLCTAFTKNTRYHQLRSINSIKMQNNSQLIITNKCWEAVVNNFQDQQFSMTAC